MIPTVLPTYNRAPLSFVKGEGSWLIEKDGTRYLDLGSGIAVNALGHANPALVAVLTEQAGKLWHVSNVYQIPEQQRLADLLTEHTFADTVFVTNSGTETAELAIKMARKYWYDTGTPRAEILPFAGAFHGRSTGAIAAWSHRSSCHPGARSRGRCPRPVTPSAGWRSQPGRRLRSPGSSRACRRDVRWPWR